MKKSIVTIVIFLFFEYNLSDDESDLFQSNDLDCRYKPSCNLSQSSNVSSIPLVAGCKCDVDCLEYNDCCKDSKYFGQSRLRSGKEFNCHPKLEVQMVTSCPEWYEEDAGVAGSCSFEVPIKDVSSVVPVTNKRTRTTYANEYCAGCHNETDFEPWDLTVDFVEVASSFLESGEFSDSGRRVDHRRSASQEDDVAAAAAAAAAVADVENASRGDDGGDAAAAAAAAGRVRVEDLLRLVRFEPAHESFVAQLRGRTFVGAFDSRMPAPMAAFVRRCLPELIAECPDDDDDDGGGGGGGGRKQRLCQSYTQIVYDRLNSLAFRNKDCAECNSVRPQDASYCPPGRTVAAAAAAHPAAHGLVISSRDKAANRHLCANSVLPGHFCPANSN